MPVNRGVTHVSRKGAYYARDVRRCRVLCFRLIAISRIAPIETRTVVEASGVEALVSVVLLHSPGSANSMAEIELVAPIIDSSKLSPMPANTVLIEVPSLPSASIFQTGEMSPDASVDKNTPESEALLDVNVSTLSVTLHEISAPASSVSLRLLGSGFER
jgi:hypothetical protein